MTLVQKLRGTPVETVLVDRHNHHLFEPLLYQVATAALSPAEIAQPIRAMTRGFKGMTVLLDEAVGLDVPGCSVLLRNGGAIDYDMLVLATGVEYNYFGHPGWAQRAPALKSLHDALEVRRRLLLAFEQAEMIKDPVQRRKLLTFVLVGGGPTGVELAGSMAELARFTLRRDFRNIDPASARVILVEAGPRLLNGFGEHLSEYALRSLQRMNVEVRLSTKIDRVDDGGVEMKDGRIDAALVVWCAGVTGTPAAAWLGVKLTRQGLVPVGPDLAVPGHPEIFVVGDLAVVTGPDGQPLPLPQVAPVAKQEAAFVAKVIAARVARRTPPPAFAYRDRGSLAIIGRSAAVVDLGWLRLDGFAGWLFWGIAHLFFLIGFRNRITVFVTWMWEWLTYGRGARLIVDP